MLPKEEYIVTKLECIFFFQAEDGIRDYDVTGVQTCALPICPMMNLALSYDHRIIDGSEAVTFLVRIKECIEDPQRILLEV